MSTDVSELALAAKLGECLLAKQWYCAVAESCTGGKLSAAITDVAGSSQWFDRGFITYTNQSKMDMLGVRSEILTSHGAVSEPTVRAMAEGALVSSSVDITCAISGVAGPGGGSVEKPVGLVWFAWSVRGGLTEAMSYCFKGGRFAIRLQAVSAALNGLILRCT